LGYEHAPAQATERLDGAPRISAWHPNKWLVPENDPLYTHTSEGPDDMPSHIKAALTATSLGIPILDGRRGLGTWQGIYIWEHRKYRSQRHVLVHVGA
jgi:secondary thiamine-phosphate synthase enzyme